MPYQTTAAGISNHYRGAAAECLFAAEALKRGYVVCDPLLEKAPYDFVVMAGARAVRVQVKSATHKAGKCYKVGLGEGDSRLGAYREGDWDVLAAYVVPVGQWYLMGQGEVKAAQMYLGERDRQWLENWEIFEVS